MKITITRALAEIKLQDARIKNKISAAVFTDCKTGKIKNTMFKGLDPKEFDGQAKADLQSVRDLIENRRKMKSGIMASNAVTRVKIGGQEYTVTEAIEKKTSIEYLKALLAEMKKQRAQMTQHATNSNAKIEQQIAQMVTQNAGGADKKLTEEDYEIIGKPFREANEVIILDPVKLAEKITALETEIEDFEKEVDFILSESNSRTEIDV